MPQSPADIVAFLKACHKQGMERLYIEQLPRFVPIAGKGGKGIPGSAAAVLFENFGITIGASLALGIPVVRVEPKTWQQEFSLGSARDCASKAAWKNKLKARAAEMFPGCKVTLATADALLIWEYGRRRGC